uniref:Uncharacterized protein n=1 Tax=Arundo donax TaxID=35708 RepID=A0A0A8ZGS5_ARUDO
MGSTAFTYFGTRFIWCTCAGYQAPWSELPGVGLFPQNVASGCWS